jgi:hypothetical protein
MKPYDTPLDHGPTRLRLGALAGAIGLVVTLVRILVEPEGIEGSVRQSMMASSAHPTLTNVMNVCEVLSWPLLAFACVTLTGLVRGRGKWLTQIGGWGVGISFLVIGINGLSIAEAELAKEPGRTAMVAGFIHLQSSPAVLPLLIPMITSILWPVVLAFGLQRARLVGWWYPVLAIVRLAMFMLLDGEHARALNLIGFVPLAVLVGVWVKLLSERTTAVTAILAAPTVGAGQPVRAPVKS